MERWKRIVALALSGGVPRRAAVVALLVGTALNLINQGDFVLAGNAPHWGKLVLTYMVPYLVSTHGAVSARMAGGPEGSRRKD